MKIKGLLLATAAGAMAATGAQAADLPSAPHPVDYVRICDTYGNGFYYIPGTDTCIRVFGRVRADYRVSVSTTGNATTNWDGAGDSPLRFRSRGYIRVDTRTETESGLLRTFIDLFATVDSSGAPVLGLDSAFIQYGNWTFGRSGSVSATNFGSTYQHTFTPYGVPYLRTNLMAYTMDLGNGVSSTIALEDNTGGKRGAGWWGSFTAATATAASASASAGFRSPELHANIRISQSWGLIHLGGAVRQNIGQAGTAVAPVADYTMGWGANLGLSGNVGGASVYLVGAYASGFSSFTTWGADMTAVGGQAKNVASWSIAAGGSTSLGNNLSAGLELYYGVQNPSGAANNTRGYGANANLVWRPVSGLQFGAEVNWRNTKLQSAANATNAVHVLFRAQRDY